MKKKTILLVSIALLVGALLGGCGGDDESSSAADATSVTGDFTSLADTPQAIAKLSGSAKLVRSDGGTDVSIALSGLRPDTRYASHLHAGACDQPDPGGPHFKFDDNGSEMPPNEIHLPFTTDADGDGRASAHNDATVPKGEGRSIVVHTVAEEHTSTKASDGHAHAHAAKIACATLG